MAGNEEAMKSMKTVHRGGGSGGSGAGIMSRDRCSIISLLFLFAWQASLAWRISGRSKVEWWGGGALAATLLPRRGWARGTVISNEKHRRIIII